MDKDNMIGQEDIRRFLMAFSDGGGETTADDVIQTMLSEIIVAFEQKNKPDEESPRGQPPGWESAPKYINFEQFKDLLDEVNNSI